MNNYEYSVQSSLIQHGMSREEMNSVEHVQDIRELENLLNDSLAKQRVSEFIHCKMTMIVTGEFQYKQRLMVFIVGQVEQASEKAELLQQLGQVCLFFLFEQEFVRRIDGISSSFLLTKNKTSVEQNSMILMMQRKQRMKSKLHSKHSMSKIVIFMSKH